MHSIRGQRKIGTQFLGVHYDQATELEDALIVSNVRLMVLSRRTYKRWPRYIYKVK